MNLTPEISNYEAQLDKLLKEVRQLDPSDDLYISMINYACIRVTGYLETAFDSLLRAYTDTVAQNDELKNVVNKYILGIQSANYGMIREVLGVFNEQWDEKFVEEVQKEGLAVKRNLTETLNSLFRLRNSVAHGGKNINIGHSELRLYYDDAKRIIRIIARIIP